MISPPYVGQVFGTGTKIIRVETLRIPTIDPDDGGEYAVLAEHVDKTTEIYYCTLLPSMDGFSYWPDKPDRSAIIAAYPHGTSEGRTNYEAARARLTGKLYIPPKVL